MPFYLPIYEPPVSQILGVSHTVVSMFAIVVLFSVRYALRQKTLFDIEHAVHYSKTRWQQADIR